jgi:flagellar protein FlgJ
MEIKAIPEGTPGSGTAPTSTDPEFQLERLRNACRDFEAVFLSYMVREMNRSVTGLNCFGEGLGSDYYRGLFEDELARSISRNGNTGIGDLLFSQLAKGQNTGRIYRGKGHSPREPIKVKGENSR